MSPTQRRAILALLFLAAAVGGCHQRRTPVQVDTGRGVHVRAPFVDVHVPTGEPKLDVESLEEDDD